MRRFIRQSRRVALAFLDPSSLTVPEHLEQQSVRQSRDDERHRGAALSKEAMLAVIRDEKLRICNNDNIAAVTTAPTVRTAFWNICFSEKTCSLPPLLTSVDMTKIGESFRVSPSNTLMLRHYQRSFQISMNTGTLNNATPNHQEPYDGAKDSV